MARIKHNSTRLGHTEPSSFLSMLLHAAISDNNVVRPIGSHSATAATSSSCVCCADPTADSQVSLFSREFVKASVSESMMIHWNI